MEGAIEERDVCWEDALERKRKRDELDDMVNGLTKRQVTYI